jgi:hypothetical protein
MATHVAVLCQFNDGSFSYLRDEISADTLTEVQTDASGLVNQTGNVSLGQANQGKVLVAALAKVQTDSATTGCYIGGGIYDSQGSFICPIQGGGASVSALPRTIKNVKMQTGVVCKVMWQASGDAVQTGGVMAYTRSGKCDFFTASASDDADVAFTNKDGSSWGESLAGQSVVGVTATYSADNGLADTGVADGVDAFFVEDAAGQLKFMAAPCKGNQACEPIPWIPAYGLKVNQNDTMICRANV